MSEYIAELTEKIRKKNEEYEHLCSLINRNIEYVKKRLSEIFGEYDINETECNNLYSMSKNESSDNISDGRYTDIMGKIYRNLLSKSHPDRHIEKTQENYCDDDFVNITKAYEEMNIGEMFRYAEKYEHNVDNDEVLLMLEKQFCSIKNKIKKIRSCVSYNLLIHGDDKSLRDFLVYHKTERELKIKLEQLEKDNAQLREKYDELNRKKHSRPNRENTAD